MLRVVVSAMGRISTFRSYQLILLLAAALAVAAFYYFGSERQNFSSTTKRIKQSQASQNANRNDADLTLDTGLTPPHEHDEGGGEDTSSVSDPSPHFHVLMMFTKIDKSRSLQEKFRVAMLSMVKHADFLEDEVLVLHFVSDQASQELGQQMLQEVLLEAAFQYEVGSSGP